MNKAWEAMMRVNNPKYNNGGKVKDSINPSSLEEVAHKDYDSGLRQVTRYKAKTYGGDQRNMVKDIGGLTNKKGKRESATEALRRAIMTNPMYSDTVSIGKAKDFIKNADKSLWELLMGKKYGKGGKIPKGYHT